MARVATARRTAAVSTFIAPSNSGKLRIYSGTRPATSNTSIGAAVLLAELTMNATSFTESAGVLTANAITQDPSADASGTASFCRLVESDGTTPVMDLGVTTSTPTAGTEVQLTSLTITAGNPVSCTAFTYSFIVGA